MKILHPNKKKYLSLEELKNYYSNGFYNIISNNEKEKLTYFLESFEDYRKGKNEKITNVALYENLPFSINSKAWQLKQKDIKIIKQLIENKTNLKILDIGCWNGWLCNNLTKKGHTLTGIDIFTDEFDGLKTIKHYDENFTLLQMLPEELDRLQEKFDLIVFNRNWSYFKNHQKIFNHAKQLLSKNGTIIFLGLSFYNNPKNIIQTLNFENNLFLKKYDIPLFYKPSKGYLDFTDKVLFKINKIHLHFYSPIKGLIKKIFKSKNQLYFGVYKNNTSKITL